jgi:pimeloyl-ACP methyl ester carboxylesterase
VLRGSLLLAALPAAQASLENPLMNAVPLEPALPGERLEWLSEGRRLVAYVDGAGPPLLLVHSVNAAASAAEMRPLHAHYRKTRTVFSIDLPGFGLSDRSDRPYTPRLMTQALHSLTEQARQRCGPQPVDALALSLSCEFLARAASQAPTQYRRLALVSPTGLAGRDERRAAPETTLAMPWLLSTLRGPGWGKLLYRGLTRPGVIRFFLNKTWGSPAIDEELWRYAVLTAQQEGAEHAPLHFLSGGLFSRDIQNVYESLTQPCWLAHGERGDFTDYRKKSLLQDRPNWRVSVFPTGAMPYFEVPDAFMAACDAFFAQA